MMMMIACACGGVLETLVLWLLGGTGVLVAAWHGIKSKFRGAR